jgi:hypothetical protein
MNRRRSNATDAVPSITCICGVYFDNHGAELAQCHDATPTATIYLTRVTLIDTIFLGCK